MKGTLNEKEFAFFANHKKDILAALYSAVKCCRDNEYKYSERKYYDMWSEFRNILEQSETN